MNNNSRKQAQPLLNPKVRKNSFLEVALGYTPEQAMEEATRCLSCLEKPCASKCPMSVDIPAFIAEVAEGNFNEAYEIITKATQVPAICSRVCSTNPKCERVCSRKDGGEAVAIAALERFTADYHNLNAKVEYNSDADIAEEISANGRRIAVLGSGPAGLACAGDLAKKGYEVTVYEERSNAGGVFDYGIPGFRLPKTVVRHEIGRLEALGVEINTDSPLGCYTEAEELLSGEGYEAVYISDCREVPGKLNIKGENLNGVISADYFLSWVNTKEKDRFYVNTPYVKGCRAVIIGGGVKALDSARCMRRFGAEVTLVYSCAESEINACPEEIKRAKEEDIKFIYLTSPIEFTGNREGRVNGIWCEKLMMRMGEGCDRPEYIPLYESEFEIPCDIVIVALDSVKEPYDAGEPENGIFSFAGTATVAEAMGAGKEAAIIIDSFVRKGVRV